MAGKRGRARSDRRPRQWVETVTVRLREDAPVWSVYLPTAGVTIRRGEQARTTRAEAEALAEQGIEVVEDA